MAATLLLLATQPGPAGGRATAGLDDGESDGAGARVEPRVYSLSDTIDVEGERLPLDPLRVPMATTRVERRALQATRGVGLDEGLALVPGVLAQSRAGGSDVRIILRGFGARGAGERSNAGTTRGIRVLLDGFPLTEPDGRTSLDLADLGGIHQIDVIRSNASALFGSASGGVINLVSESPFSRPFEEGRLTLGSFGFRRGEGRAGRFAGKARVRLGASRTAYDGWRSHSAGDATSVEASVLVETSPRGSLGLFVRGVRNRFEMPGALTRSELLLDQRQADSNFVRDHNRRDNRIGRIAARWQQGIGNSQHVLAGLYLEPKYLERAERGRYRDFKRVHAGGSLLYSDGFSVGSDVRGRLSCGLDEAFQDGSILFYTLGPNGTRGSELKADTREGINQVGAYAEAALERARISATAGIRYDLVRYIFEDHQDSALDETKTLKRASPRLALSWRHRPGHALYATLSGGIEAPAFNEVDPPPELQAVRGLNPFLEPAYSYTHEIGAKGRTGLGGARSTSGAGPGFQYDLCLYRIEIYNDIIPYDGGSYYFTAGRSRRVGGEIGSSLDTRWGIRLSASAALSRNEYLRYRTILPGQEAENDFGGNDAAGIPPAQIAGRIEHDLPWGLGVEIGARHLSSYYADDANQARVAAFTLLDATARGRLRLGAISADLFVSLRNLTDRRHTASVFINGVNGRYYEPGAERNVLAGFSLGRPVAD